MDFQPIFVCEGMVAFALFGRGMRRCDASLRLKQAGLALERGSGPRRGRLLLARDRTPRRGARESEVDGFGKKSGCIYPVSGYNLEYCKHNKTYSDAMKTVMLGEVLVATSRGKQQGSQRFEIEVSYATGQPAIG